MYDYAPKHLPEIRDRYFRKNKIANTRRMT